VIAARGVNRWPDTLISTLGLIFYATPSFWFGLMAIVVFSIYLQWLPAGGFSDITQMKDRHLRRCWISRAISCCRR
jgi:peptide/nickel transport system permease protein